jgi:dihydroorotate dehydrogenase electron transfer subunit
LDEAPSAVIYACGPEAMLRAVARLGLERGIATQVCMERVMACGMGTCQSCVVRVHDSSAEDGWRYRLCCTDGPVFDAREIVWA